MSERPLVIRFNCEVISSSSKGSPWMFGETLFSSFTACIPSFLISSKDTDTELIIKNHFKLNDPRVDRGDNWVVDGFADFGLAGCLLYGVMLSLILLAFECAACMVSPRSPFFSLCLLAGLLDIAASVESNAVQLFSFVRNSVGLWVILRSIGLLFPRSTRGGFF